MADDAGIVEYARSLLGRKSYRCAIGVLTPWLEDHPKDAEALDLLGAAHAGAGQWEDAERAEARLVEITPDSGRAWTNWGTALRKVGRLDKAREAQRRAMNIDPAYRRAHVEVRKIERDARLLPSVTGPTGIGVTHGKDDMGGGKRPGKAVPPRHDDVHSGGEGLPDAGVFVPIALVALAVVLVIVVLVWWQSDRLVDVRTGTRHVCEVCGAVVSDETHMVRVSARDADAYHVTTMPCLCARCAEESVTVTQTVGYYCRVCGSFLGRATSQVTVPRKDAAQAKTAADRTTEICSYCKAASDEAAQVASVRFTGVSVSQEYVELLEQYGLKVRGTLYNGGTAPLDVGFLSGHQLTVVYFDATGQLLNRDDVYDFQPSTVWPGYAATWRINTLLHKRAAYCQLWFDGVLFSY